MNLKSKTPLIYKTGGSTLPLMLDKLPASLISDYTFPFHFLSYCLAEGNFLTLFPLFFLPSILFYFFDIILPSNLLKTIYGSPFSHIIISPISLSLTHSHINMHTLYNINIYILLLLLYI
jgi:hypothetical protein